MRVLIALGGNAMTAPDGSARPEDQHRAVTEAMATVARIVADSHEVVLTHGNGPQVGNLLVKNELAASVVPPVPLDWCGAQTQGTIGLLIMDALENALRRIGISPRVAVLVSRTVVDADDSHFHNPTKPIGRYLPAAEAAVMIAHGQSWQDRGERGWRRVVASPEPIACLEADAAQALLAQGYVVVCAGGGGVPVVRGAEGELRSVEAVIDKDLTAAVLGAQLDADLMIIATDVDAVMLGWPGEDARAIGTITAAELLGLAAQGHFAEGSMGPKVMAACRFAATGRRAVITSLNRVGDAMAGAAGTIVVG